MMNLTILAFIMNISIPMQPIGNDAVAVSTEQDKPFTEWTETDHGDSFDSLQKTASFWREKNTATQHLVYGSYTPSSPSFSFQAVPFKDSNFFTRFFRQLRVLYRVTFGASTLSAKEKQSQTNKYQALLNGDTERKIFPAANAPSKTDAFCRADVIEKQKITETDLVNVLYNYAPIGFGGEKLHFLITPKAHRTTFAEVTREEYIDAALQVQRLIATLSRTRHIVKVHFLRKSGEDAGQTVPHWHWHVIIQTNELQGITGSLTVLRNMAMGGSSPIKREALAIKVASLTAELDTTQEEQAQ